MKMTTGDNFPRWQGARTGSILVFRGYRGLRWRNFWSRVISDGFSIYKFLVNYFAIFHFPIYKPKIPKIFNLPFIYLYQISLLQVTVKGLTTTLSRWVQVFWLFVQVFGDLCIVSYWIDTLVLKTEGNTYSALLDHPFHFKYPRLRLFQKWSSWRFHSVWIPFDIPFLWNTEIGKK